MVCFLHQKDWRRKNRIEQAWHIDIMSIMSIMSVSSFFCSSSRCQISQSGRVKRCKVTASPHHRAQHGREEYLHQAPRHGIAKGSSVRKMGTSRWFSLPLNASQCIVIRGPSHWSPCWIKWAASCHAGQPRQSHPRRIKVRPILSFGTSLFLYLYIYIYLLILQFDFEGCPLGWKFRWRLE